MNIVILSGRLTSNPELRQTQNGKSVTIFSLAITRDYDKDKADFIQCQAWGKNAENIAKYLKKGDPINIEGRWETGSYVDQKTNTTVYTNRCVIDKFHFSLERPKPKATPQPVQNPQGGLMPNYGTWGAVPPQQVPWE